MSLPYFPMYPKDFEGKTSHLTLEEDGAYNRLLRLQWMNPTCRLPNDDAWIMRRMRVDKKAFDRVVKVIISEFFTTKGAYLYSPKLLEVYKQSGVAHSKRVKAGKQGGHSKARNYKHKDPSNAVAMPYQPEPEPEPIREITTTLVSSNDVPASPKGEDKNQFTKEFETIWPHYPRKVSKKQSLINYIKARKKFSYDDIAKPLREFIDATMKFGDPENMIHFSTWLQQERFSDEDQQAAVTGRTSKGYTNGRQQDKGSISDWSAKAATADLTPPPDGT
ncbi:MAG: hypothetical protein COA96_10295 [SAR86 cluster bacterium]|uniref:DUF1376 domain-containing protein n=1 Tax=SAR86 cluster bacterium TaxID=2030880 RepID=A0A2A5AZ47_9GAMM|nr:MAG: hypothetical protein COA96_10295 [SAR86 cluster bacterium]